MKRNEPEDGSEPGGIHTELEHETKKKKKSKTSKKPITDLPSQPREDGEGASPEPLVVEQQHTTAMDPEMNGAPEGGKATSVEQPQPPECWRSFMKAFHKVARNRLRSSPEQPMAAPQSENPRCALFTLKEAMDLPDATKWRKLGFVERAMELDWKFTLEMQKYLDDMLTQFTTRNPDSDWSKFVKNMLFQWPLDKRGDPQKMASYPRTFAAFNLLATPGRILLTSMLTGCSATSQLDECLSAPPQQHITSDAQWTTPSIDTLISASDAVSGCKTVRMSPHQYERYVELSPSW